MKTGDFVSIDYIGKVKETGEIFDVTKEDVAKKENVYNPRLSYRPISVVVDANFVIKGLDDVLKEMNVGDKKTVIIDPDKGFGERNLQFVRPVPISQFKDQEISPTPGSYITINGVRGRIVSADGGRVKVDFNHPLAGKKLEYEIEVKREITDTVEKIKSVASFITTLDPEKVDVKLNGTEAEVKLDAKEEIPGPAKKQIADLTIKWVRGIEKLKFVDEYSGEKTDEKADAKDLSPKIE